MLLERLASAGCVPWRGDDAPIGTTIEAAVRCEPSGSPATQLTLVAFTDLPALRDAWRTYLDALEPPLDENDAACEGSTAGVRRWGFGGLACRVADGASEIAWTDTRGGLLGVVQGDALEVGELYAWWQDSAKPLGRTQAEEPTPSGPNGDRPLVRVPGAPSDVICTNLDEPIVDLHGRSWQLERVRFLDEPKFERVVLALQRTGRVREGRGAQVTVERMPVADVATEFPGAPRPRRGQTALAVRMEGVVQAPDLRAYRPQGLDLVRELSIVRGTRARTAILALAGDGCYQVRIPVFGPSATGNEDRAEIFVDIQR